MSSPYRTIIQAAADEGIGSLYERVLLAELLPRLMKRRQVNSILEYPAIITKGWDSANWLGKHQVTIADTKDQRFKKLWPFTQKPHFIPESDLKSGQKKFDLVWNFAYFHQHPDLYSQLKKVSSRYLLIFTPNIFNWGAPLHWGLHLLTRTRCHHPENGPVELMTRWGLAAYFEKKGWRVVESGYVDMPPWPDFAFAKAQLQPHWPFSWLWPKAVPAASAKKAPPVNVSKLAETIAWSARWERAGVPNWLQPLFAHHQYVLVEKK